MLGKCVTAIQGDAFRGYGKWWGEPGHAASSDGLSDSVSCLMHGVCWEIRVSQGPDLAFIRKDGMFLVHFHALVEVHFQGSIRLCTSIRHQQLEPFWIYMLDAAALM